MMLMVVIAPRSAVLVESRGARFTLLLGYVFILGAFLTMLLLWDKSSPYWHIGLAYGLVGIGIGFAGTPASHSLTGSVPVSRAGMASATADLQRDLGGAIMQSILGAVLTEGMPAVQQACAEALAQSVHSADVILNILFRKRDPVPPPLLLTSPALRLTHEPKADCARYDLLRRVG